MLMTRVKAAEHIRTLKAACVGDEQPDLARAFDLVIEGLMETGEPTLSLKDAKNKVEAAWTQFDRHRDRLPIIAMIKLVRDVYREATAASDARPPIAEPSRLMMAGALLAYVSGDDVTLTHDQFRRTVADRIYSDLAAFRPVNETIIKDIAKRAVDAISDGWGDDEDRKVAGQLEAYFREAARRA